MKKLNIYKAFFTVVACMAIFFACKDDDEIFPETRLFQPVLSEDLTAKDNTIIVNMGKMKKAKSYTVEVSRDTFKTIDYTIPTEQNYLVLDATLLNGDPLLWNTLYQIRATAHAEDPQFDSKVSMLGNVRTEKYPSIMTVPTAADVVDVGARVFWANEGAAVTAIKVYAATDLKLATPLAQYQVSADDQEALMKIIYGLQPGTEYTVAIYSDGELRGYENYKTLPQGPTGSLVIDLRQVAFKETLVTDTIPDIPAGSLILLKKGKTYVMNGSALQIDKSLTIMSGLDFGDNAALYIAGNFDFPASGGGTIDSLVFRNVSVEGTGLGTNYVANFSRPGTIHTLKFDNVSGKIFRGFVRTKDNDGITIKNYIINNCVIDSIGNYGILTVDKGKVENIVIQNSTISKANVFISSKNNSNSIFVSGCTMSETPAQAVPMFRYNGSAGFTDVLSGISIKDCIWGHGWDMTGSGVKTVVGTAGLAATHFTVVNNHATSDFGFSSKPIAGFPSFTYNNTAENLWEDPYDEVFSFKDTGFSGRFDSGDPRWRIKL